MSEAFRHQTALARGHWFRQLPPEFSQALLDRAQVRQLQAGEVLFLRDGAPCGLYGLVSGSIRFSGHSGSEQSTRKALLVLLSAPSWFGEISVFDHSARTHDAHAAEPSTLLHVPHAPLQDWLRAHPQHWRDLGLLMADKLRLAFQNIESLTVLPATQRLAQRLLLMAQGHGQVGATSGSRRVLSVTQEDLAQMLGVSRQTVNEILTELKGRQVIRVQRGEVEILDLAALQAFAD
jgi:CRP/FNR family cyclic AMP-dependent transcriptional regulator